jgi:hypothetical protein
MSAVGHKSFSFRKPYEGVEYTLKQYEVEGAIVFKPEKVENSALDRAMIWKLVQEDEFAQFLDWLRLRDVPFLEESFLAGFFLSGNLVWANAVTTFKNVVSMAIKHARDLVTEVKLALVPSSFRALVQAETQRFSSAMLEGIADGRIRSRQQVLSSIFLFNYHFRPEVFSELNKQFQDQSELLDELEEYKQDILAIARFVFDEGEAQNAEEIALRKMIFDHMRTWFILRDQYQTAPQSPVDERAPELMPDCHDCLPLLPINLSKRLEDAGGRKSFDVDCDQEESSNGILPSVMDGYDQGAKSEVGDGGTLGGASRKKEVSSAKNENSSSAKKKKKKSKKKARKETSRKRGRPAFDGSGEKNQTGSERVKRLDRGIDQAQGPVQSHQEVIGKKDGDSGEKAISLKRDRPDGTAGALSRAGGEFPVKQSKKMPQAGKDAEIKQTAILNLLERMQVSNNLLLKSGHIPTSDHRAEELCPKTFKLVKDLMNSKDDEECASLESLRTSVNFGNAVDKLCTSDKSRSEEELWNALPDGKTRPSFHLAQAWRDLALFFKQYPCFLHQKDVVRMAKWPRIVSVLEDILENDPKAKKHWATDPFAPLPAAESLPTGALTSK